MISILAMAATLVAAPFCPTGHSQRECEDIWAASQALAATQHLSQDRQVSAAATAIQLSRERAPPTVLPLEIRARFLYEITDLISQAAHTTVVLKKAIAFTERPDMLVCGSGVFSGRLQTFFMDGNGLRRGATAKQMDLAGCNAGGGNLLADY